MAYAVSKYQDVIRKKEKPEKDRGAWEMALYFDTEAEARAFIQDRALRRVKSCEEALVKAKAQLAKCRKKFPV